MQFNTPLIEGLLIKRYKRLPNKTDKSVDGKEIKRSRSQHYLNQTVFYLQIVPPLPPLRLRFMVWL
ncbi:MAG: hypothetical protein OXC48_03340 [Endozoicomonadaceae bacterium]|nr:hypothetical protein [Endozoicomonadaceae bacterium]